MGVMWKGATRQTVVYVVCKWYCVCIVNLYCIVCLKLCIVCILNNKALKVSEVKRDSGDETLLAREYSLIPTGGSQITFFFWCVLWILCLSPAQKHQTFSRKTGHFLICEVGVVEGASLSPKSSLILTKGSQITFFFWCVLWTSYLPKNIRPFQGKPATF